MKHFKNIKVIKSNKYYKEIESFNKDGTFKIIIYYDYDKIKTKFIKDFSFKGKSFLEKIKDCYRILTNKPFILSSEFEFKDGEHVVNVSDMLYILSKNIKRNIK